MSKEYTTLDLEFADMANCKLCGNIVQGGYVEISEGKYVCICDKCKDAIIKRKDSSMREKMFISRIVKTDKTKTIFSGRGISYEAESIGVTIGETQLVITPDFDGFFRIHKRNLDNCVVIISPSCSNEVLIK